MTKGCVTRHEISWTFFSCEHNFVSRVLVFLFFCLSSCQLSSCKQHILFYHCLLMVAMTISRILVSLGRKLCLFVYYVKQVDNKQWVAKEAANIQWRWRIGRFVIA
jgi:hypothetical protein